MFDIDEMYRIFGATLTFARQCTDKYTVAMVKSELVIYCYKRSLIYNTKKNIILHI